MVEDLLPCWRAELAEAGYPPARLAATVERAGRDYVPPGADIVDQLADELLGPSGRLATEKTFDLPEAVVAVAPLLHGLPVSMLDTALHKVLSDERAVALPLVAGARGPVWAAACVLEDRRHVAEPGRPAGRPQSAGRPGRGRSQCGPGYRTGPRRPSQREKGRSGQGVTHFRALA